MDLEEYISKRCEKALMRSVEYKALNKLSLEAYQRNDIVTYSDINTSMQMLIEKICYQACAQDLLGTNTELE